MARVSFVSDRGGDWMAMYIDGQLVDETHMLDAYRIITPLVGKHITTLEFFESDFEEFGRGYETLDEYTDFDDDPTVAVG